jgi:hypothetical protein
MRWIPGSIPLSLHGPGMTAAALPVVIPEAWSESGTLSGIQRREFAEGDMSLAEVREHLITSP